MAFEPQLLPAITGAVDSLVIVDSVFAPNTIIRRDQLSQVVVNWHMNGLLAFGLGGSWTVRALLESIGPGFEGDAGAPQNVALAAGTVVLPDRKNFNATITVNPNTIPAGLYKLATVITYTEPSGTPGPMAAYLEGPMVQFFEP